MGSRVQADFASGVVEIEHRDSSFDARSARLPQAMRSSILLVPALLTRFGQARIEDEVRGCTLGVREIDPHVEVFEQFGARIERGDDGWVLRVQRPLQATTHWLDYASVTTTENFVLCAVLARGRSTLTNAACEPHVQEFCRFLSRMGARIAGCGSSRLQIDGLWMSVGFAPANALLHQAGATMRFDAALRSTSSITERASRSTSSFSRAAPWPGKRWRDGRE